MKSELIQSNTRHTQAAVLHVLVQNFPAFYSDDDVLASVATDPDEGRDEVAVRDALIQLRADQLIRRHENRYWSASPVAVKLCSLLDL
jgi:hypothetical protein